MNNVLINHESSVVNVQRRELEKNQEKVSKVLELVNMIEGNVEEFETL